MYVTQKTQILSFHKCQLCRHVSQTYIRELDNRTVRSMVFTSPHGVVWQLVHRSKSSTALPWTSQTPPSSHFIQSKHDFPCSSCYLDAILSPQYSLRQRSQLTKRSRAGFALRPARTGFQGSCLYVEDLKIWKSCAYLVPICDGLKMT